MPSPIACVYPLRLCRVLVRTAALCMAAFTLPLGAADWVGGSGTWSSNSNPGWNGAGVPNAVGASVTLGGSPESTTTLTQDVSGGVTVGSISVTSNTNSGWTINNTLGITLSQDGAGSGAASITYNNTTGTGNNGLLIGGGTLTLADNLSITNLSTINNATAGPIRITSPIAGTGNITFSNAQTPTAGTTVGTIHIGGVNTFSGSVLVQKGTVYMAGGSGLGSASNAVTVGASGQGSAALYIAPTGTYPYAITIASGTGGTSTLAGTTNNQTFSGTLTLTGDLTHRRSGTGTTTLSGQVTGAGKLTHAAGTLRLTNSSNDYSGGTTISGGTLHVQGSGQLGSGAVQVASGATLGFANISADTYTLSSALSGTGTVTLSTKNLTLVGQVSPGDAGAGSLSITGTGTLQFGAGTSFAYTLGTSSTQLSIAGVLGLGSGEIEFGDFSFTTGTGFGAGQYTLITGATSSTGSLGTTLTGAIGSGYTGTLSMSGNNLVLDVVTAVPEPATSAALAGAAVLGLAVVRRRIRRGAQRAG